MTESDDVTFAFVGKLGVVLQAKPGPAAPFGPNTFDRGLFGAGHALVWAISGLLHLLGIQRGELVAGFTDDIGLIFERDADFFKIFFEPPEDVGVDVAAIFG